MDRAISLPDAVNHLRHVKDATKPATEYNEGFIDALDFCVSYLLSLPSAQPEIIRCKDCKHRPVTNDNYDDDEWDCGFNIEFPDYRCPCQCDDGYYNRLPDDNWFCGNAERRTGGQVD